MPERIGPYEVEGHLGVGGMGETYVALRRGPGGFEQRVCLKRIRADVADDPELVRQFLAEARTMARLRHAGIAQVLDFGEDGGQYYLALELVEGMDLRVLLERGGSLDAETLLHLALELTTALGVAHRAEDGAVIHRDISSSNVLVSREGEIKLTDFGIARPLEGPTHTRTGVVKGKVPYLAPEYARTGEVDVRCDLYSLGVTLYECAAAVRPYDGETDLDTLERAARGQRLALREHCPELPLALASVIERLIDPDPAQRPSSAAELLETLEALPPPSPRARRELGERVRSLATPATARLPRRPTPAELAPTALDGRATGAPADGAGSSVAPTRTSAAPHDAPPPPPGLGPGRRSLLTLLLSIVVAAGVFLLVDRRQPATPEALPAPDLREEAAPATASAPPEAAAQDAPAGPSPVVVLPEGEDTPAADTEPAPARLEVVVLPFGQVSVDGKPRGRSPVRLKLEPGTHRITARNSDGTIQRTVTLKPGERRRVQLP